MRMLLLGVNIVLSGTILCMTGCNMNEEGRATDPAKAADLQTSSEKADTLLFDGSTRLWSSASGTGNARITQVVNFEAIHTEIHNWELDGYTYSPQRSFVASTYIKPDSSRPDSFYVELVTLILNSTEDFENKGVFIQYFYSPDFGSGLQVSEISFIPQSEEGWNYIEDRLWTRTHIMPLYSRTRIRMASVDLWAYFKCQAGETAEHCLESAVGCVMTTAAWGGCTAGLCVASAVGASIHCAGKQFGWW